MTKPAKLSLPPIYKGATYDAPLKRFTVPYAVRWDCERLVNACTGAIVPDSDKTPEDYTGCTAIAQFLRDGNPEDVILELTSSDGIELDGDTLWLRRTDEQTAEMEIGDTPPAWSECVVRITVFRPNGDAEPQYELPVVLLPWRQA